jgi:arsenate reductase
MKTINVLILCTGNSCRSQMAQAILQSLNQNIDVFSAGTVPADHVHPVAIQVMQELGVDIKEFYPKSVDNYLNTSFDYVITVCQEANESCPIFTGNVVNRQHIGFEDPAKAIGDEEQIINKFRKIRDEILRDFFTFNQKYLLK